MRPLRLAMLMLCACGGAQPGMDGGVDAGLFQPFLATPADFEGYAHWRSFDFGDQPADVGHFAGHRIVYLNAAPPHGAASWPVGTVLVKEVIPDGGATEEIFGMAKRGGDYNDGGALGWEWFGLAPQTSPPVFLWRGTIPPSGAYGNDGPASCDGCHLGAGANDDVLGAPLQLSGF